MSAPLLLLSGVESTLQGVEARLAGDDERHELRLDLLDRIDDDAFALLRRHGSRLAVACRGSAQGGGFRGPMAERIALLRRARDSGVRWVEVELDAALAGAGGGPGWIVSQRLNVGLEDLATVAARLAEVPASLHRLDLAVEGAEELLALHALPRGAGAWLVAARGQAAAFVQARPAAFGLSGSVLPAREGTGGAGLAHAEALRWRLADHERLGLMVLAGGPQVLLSPGPEVYNALFARQGLAFQYLPLPARDLGVVLALAEHLGVTGMSITQPFKAAMRARCHEVCAWSTQSGSVNTALWRTGGWRGWNTDAPAIGELLAARLPHPGARVLLLGNGDTASSVAAGLARAGVEVTLAARDPGRSPPSLQAAGHRVVPWDARTEVRCHGLVNCTSLGTSGEDSPWPAEAPLPGALLVDLSIRTGRESAMVRRGRAEGRTTVSGLELWCRQGAAQMSLLTGVPFTVDQLTAALRERRFLDGG